MRALIANAILVLLLAGCNLIPTEPSMVEVQQWDAGKKKSSCRITKSGLTEIRAAGLKTGTICGGLTVEVESSTISGEALQAQAAQSAALIGAFMQLIQTNPGLLQGLGGGGQ